MLVRLLVRAGHRVSIIAPEQERTGAAGGYESRLVRADSSAFLSPRWFHELGRAFSAVAAGGRPDIIFSEGYYALGVGDAAAGIPIVAFTHNFHLVHFLTNFLEIDGPRALASYVLRTVPRLLYRMLRYEIPFLRDVSKVCPASEHHALLLEKYYRLRRGKMTPLQNWVDPDTFRPASPGEKSSARATLGLSPEQTVFLAVGALWRPKGFHIAIAAFSRAAKERPDAVLLIAGAGQDEASLKRLARGLLPEDRVRFLGDIPRAELPRIYAASDIFVMSSLFPEVLSYALLEAMSAGLAPIVTTVGGNEEAAGDAGIFVPPGDAEQLGKAMSRLAAEAQLRQELSSAARQRVLRLFSEKAALSKLERILP